MQDLPAFNGVDTFRDIIEADQTGRVRVFCRAFSANYYLHIVTSVFTSTRQIVRST